MYILSVGRKEENQMEKNKNSVYTLQLLLSYVIFGSVGLFVRFIPLSSAVIAAFRGLTGALFILIFLLCRRKRPDSAAIKANLLLLLISGTAIGFNWILLFEAYRYTTVATATLCYYMASVFVVLASPFLLKEKFSLKKAVCVAVALVGMIFVSGVFKTGFSGYKGILFGLGAALLYAAGILCNKLMGEIAGADRALIQLFTAGLVVVPYMLAAEDVTVFSIDVTGAVLLFIVGIVHTGFAYVINLGAIGKLPAQTVAVFSYTDPIVAIILSAVILGEIPDIYGIIGAVLILGSTAVSSLSEQTKKLA